MKHCRKDLTPRKVGYVEDKLDIPRTNFRTRWMKPLLLELASRVEAMDKLELQIQNEKSLAAMMVIK